MFPLVEMAAPALTAKVQAHFGAEDGGFKECMSCAKGNDELVKKFQDDGGETLSDFMAYFAADNYETECTTFRDEVEVLKDKQIEVARLRVAYQVSSMALKEGATMTPAKEKQVDWEAPLEDADKKSTLEVWSRRYNMKLTMYLDPADPLVNRLYREFRVSTPRLIPVEKIRSTLQNHSPTQLRNRVWARAPPSWLTRSPTGKLKMCMVTICP